MQLNTLYRFLIFFNSLVSSKINLWRYKDPVLGPRLIPNYLQPTENNIIMTKDTKFSLDHKKKVIEYDDGLQQSKQLLGNTIIYIVQ